MESLETGQAGSPGHVAKHKGDAPGHAKGFGAAAQAFKRSAANERKRKKQRAPVGPRLSLPSHSGCNHIAPAAASLLGALVLYLLLFLLLVWRLYSTLSWVMPTQYGRLHPLDSGLVNSNES